jgi:hypothetical protein
MYGAFSGMSFGLIALGALALIAFGIFASPLIAVIIALVAAVGLFIGMSVLRQSSEAADAQPGGADDTHSSPELRRRAGRAGGAPASGEGQS